MKANVRKGFLYPSSAFFATILRKQTSILRPDEDVGEDEVLLYAKVDRTMSERSIINSPRCVTACGSETNGVLLLFCLHLLLETEAAKRRTMSPLRITADPSESPAHIPSTTESVCLFVCLDSV